MTAPVIERVLATPAAAALVEDLRRRHGEVMFYLSHGCCDGSTPMCLAPGELSPGAGDRLWGHAAGAAFWVSAAQAEYLASLQLTLDVAPGNNGASAWRTAAACASCWPCDSSATKSWRLWAEPPHSQRKLSALSMSPLPLYLAIFG